MPLSLQEAFFSNTDPLSIAPAQTMPVKMLITFEPHGLFGSSFADLFILNFVESLVCKTMTKLCRASFWRWWSF